MQSQQQVMATHDGWLLCCLLILFVHISFCLPFGASGELSHTAKDTVLHSAIVGMKPEGQPKLGFRHPGALVQKAVSCSLHSTC